MNKREVDMFSKLYYCTYGSMPPLDNKDFAELTLSEVDAKLKEIKALDYLIEVSSQLKKVENLESFERFITSAMADNCIDRQEAVEREVEAIDAYDVEHLLECWGCDPSSAQNYE